MILDISLNRIILAVKCCKCGNPLQLHHDRPIVSLIINDYILLVFVASEQNVRAPGL